MKWSRTKHLETAKNSSPKVLGITTGEQGQLAPSLPGKVTVINVCYLSSGLFCQEDNSVTMQGFNTTYYFCLSVFPIFGDFMHTIISGTFLQVNYFKTVWVAFFPTQLFETFRSRLMYNSSPLILWGYSFKKVH